MDSAFYRFSGFMTFDATVYIIKHSPLTAASAVSSKNDYAALCTQIAAMPLFMASRALFAIRRSLCDPHRMRDIPEGREAMFLRASAARRPKCLSPDLFSPFPPTFVTVERCVLVFVYSVVTCRCGQSRVI